MSSADLRRIHAITDNFFFWQGLRWVPMGAALVICSIAWMPSIPVPNELRSWIGVLVILLALWLSGSVVGGYYARNFGRVQGDASRHTTRTRIKLYVVYPAWAFALIVDAKWKPSILVSSIVLALAIEAYRESTGNGRHHYVVASILLLAFALLPWFGVVPTGVDAVTAEIGICGAIYVVGGLLDHRELVRALGGANATGPVDVGAV